MRKNHNGFFITFESTKEGLGKTTQSKLLSENLKRAGFDVVLTHEPGGTSLGQNIRKLLLDAKATEGTVLSKSTELFLFMADRSQHYKEVIKPALKGGKIVICDRFFDSTLVYQGSGRGWKNAFLWRLHHATTGSLIPDLTLVFDGKPYKRRSDLDRMERENDRFHKQVADSMRHIATRNQDNRYRILHANQPQEQLAELVLQQVLSRMAEKGLPKP